MRRLRWSPVTGVFYVFVTFALACRQGRLLRNGLTYHDKQLIVDLHNRMRSTVANGQIRGQPAAADMMEMSWDEELAAKAQQWANQCISGHDSDSARRVGRFAVGQNIASAWSSPNPTRTGSNPDFSTMIMKWFNEVYQFRGGFSHGTGHYSQMVWSETYLVGCGYSYYNEGSKYTKLYICNYGPGGNVLGRAPYKQGSPSCARFGTSPSRRYPGLCQGRGSYYG